MPNTPVIVLHGVAIYCLGQNVYEEDKERVDDLLSSVGVGMEMQEHYMDIMTGLTGGGPSFVSRLRASSRALYSIYSCVGYVPDSIHECVHDTGPNTVTTYVHTYNT